MSETFITANGTAVQTAVILDADLEKEICKTQAFYTKKIKALSGPGVYSKYDWARINFVFSEVKKMGADSILDVGVGGGHLINTLGSSRCFKQVAGLDIKRHSKFLRMADNFEMHYASVSEMPFSDNSFDIVLCMEVLEHLDPVLFHAGLRELRRVCKKTLIMTVPFEEPEPIPSFHKQRFIADDLRKWWPTAEYTLLKKPKFNWAMMTEQL
jgi:ubiquinone/menaquinone biosynthesis C-methylase UbiE